MPRLPIATALQTLVDRQVEFVITGTLAAVLRGAPYSTPNLEIVYAGSDKNQARLSPQDHADWPFELLESIGVGHDYAALLPHSREMEITPELRLFVLDLETIIAIAEEARSEVDLFTLPWLHRTLQETQRLENPQPPPSGAVD